MTALLLVVAAALAGEVAAEPARRCDEVWELARDQFFDPGMNGVDWPGERERCRAAVAGEPDPDEDEVAAAIDAMLATLGTSHTRYLTRDDAAYYHLVDIFKDAYPERVAELFPQSGRPSYVGLGVELVEDETGSYIAMVLAGGPAAGAGLRAGERILSAEGEPFHPVRSLRGRDGKTTTLAVRGHRGEAREVRVTPARIYPKDLYLEAMRASARLIDRAGEKIAYVHVGSYAGGEYHDLLVELVTGGGELAAADALLLDLRGGWGGASARYLNLYHRRVPVFTSIARDGQRTEYDPQWRKPVALLVDRRSRSGKEILAAGFRRYGIGPVIGTRTAGAVVAGRFLFLADGNALYLATRDVLVDGVRLEGKGVEPDVVVPFDPREPYDVDPQIEAGVERLRRLLAD